MLDWITTINDICNFIAVSIFSEIVEKGII